MNEKIIRLPRLRITAIDANDLSVSFDEPKWIGEGWIICIRSSPGTFLWGRFISVDGEQKTARFVLDRQEDRFFLQPGVEYEYLDGYWGKRAELVFDRSRKWSRMEFKPTDAVEFILKDKRVRGKWGQKPMAGAESIHRVEGGWDHEHCQICWESISQFEGDQKSGYKNQNDEWLCDRCFNSFVKQKSIDFIIEPQQNNQRDP